MVETSVIRNPTKEELTDFTPVADKRGRIKSPMSKFNGELAKQMLKANKKGLPFASHAARDDYKDEADRQMKASLRKHGFVDPKDIKMPKIDWSKYSDLKNFDLVEEDAKHDEHLSKRHNKSVYVKFKVYRYKGYINKYRIMQDPYEAVKESK